MSDEIKAAVGAVETIGRAFEEFKAANDANLKSRDVVLEQKLEKIEAAMTEANKRTDEALLAVKRAQRISEAEEKIEEKAIYFAAASQAMLNRTVKLDREGIESYKAGLLTYIRGGLDMLADGERKALSVGGDPNGGYLVHADMSGRIVQKIFDTSPMRAYASVQTISTDALEGLYDLNEFAAVWVSETGARNTTATADLGKWRIPTHELAAKPKATQKVLDDAIINLEDWISTRMGESFARAEATSFVNGDGVARPRGFLTYPHGSTLPGTIQQFKTGVDGGFAGTGAGIDTLLDALYGLKAQYRANATWFMNRVTLAGVRKLKDTDGAYLWMPSVAAGQPSTLLGYPVAPAFEDMPSFTTTDALAIAVGDMRAAYQIVDRVGIRTLRDPYSSKPDVEFYSTKRVGGDVIDFDAIKLIEFSV